jgi:hypothetical protein
MLLSTFAFDFKLRRYIKAAQESGCAEIIEYVRANGCPSEIVDESDIESESEGSDSDGF